MIFVIIHKKNTNFFKIINILFKITLNYFYINEILYKYINFYKIKT